MDLPLYLLLAEEVMHSAVWILDSHLPLLASCALVVTHLAAMVLDLHHPLRTIGMFQIELTGIMPCDPHSVVVDALHWHRGSEARVCDDAADAGVEIGHSVADLEHEFDREGVEVA